MTRNADQFRLNWSLKEALSSHDCASFISYKCHFCIAKDMI